MGWPVLAMLRVPLALDVLSLFSSLMLPPRLRVSVAPVLRLMNVPSFGPPVPAARDLGSLDFGQPNWFIKPGMTRWK